MHRRANWSVACLQFSARFRACIYRALGDGGRGTSHTHRSLSPLGTQTSAGGAPDGRPAWNSNRPSSRPEGYHRSPKKFNHTRSTENATPALCSCKRTAEAA